MFNYQLDKGFYNDKPKNFGEKIISKPIKPDGCYKHKHNFFVNGNEYYGIACYAGYITKSYDYFALVYPWEDINREYLEFVLNDPFLGEFAITKDVDEGQETGFYFNVKEGVSKASVSLIAFRFFFDALRYGDNTFNWNKFMDAGFSELESFWLAETATTDGKNIYYSLYNDEHCLGFYRSKGINRRRLCFSCFNRENTLKNQHEYAFKMWENKKSVPEHLQINITDSIKVDEMKEYLRGCK